MSNNGDNNSRSNTNNQNRNKNDNKNSPLHHGDKVQFNHDGIECEGIISERKGGWYTVQIIDFDGSTNTDNNNDNSNHRRIVKKRASQMSKIAVSELAANLDPYGSGTIDVSSSSTTSSQEIMDVGTNTNGANKHKYTQKEEDYDRPNIKVQNQVIETRNERQFNVEQIEKIPDFLTIIDLDAAMMNQQLQRDKIKNLRDLQYIEQCFEFNKYNEWVVFTDLHCSPSSLTTCLKVLEEVHKTAKGRGAGVLFLGDFWHHRGTVRVDCLNAVLNTLSEWEVPMIMVSIL